MEDGEKLTITDITGTGKYQILLYIICFHATGFFGTTMVTLELLAPTVNMYWDWDDKKTNSTVFSSVQCKMHEIMEYNRTSNFSNSNSKLIYVSQYSRNTLTEQLNMVCENSWLVSFANLLCLLGTSLGNVLLRLSEKYGRKRTFVVAAGTTIVSSLCMSFPQGYIMFAIATLLFRAASSQCGFIIFILAVETTAPSHAAYIGILLKSGLVIMQTIFVGVAWILRDWFYTQLFQTVITFAFLPGIWYMKESPVWLAVRGRYQEARDTLSVIVKRNGGNLSEAEPKINLWLEQMEKRCEVDTKAEKGKFKDLFKNKTISFYSCGLAFLTSITGLIVCALTMNVSTFGSGMYVDLTASNAFACGSVVFAALFLKKSSLRVMFVVCFVLECLACIVFTTTSNIPLARSVITVIARILITPVAALLMVYVNEVFPTSVRGVGTGFVSLVSGILMAPSPFTKEISEVTSLYVPFIAYAILCLVSAVVLVLLPETKGKPMIHTVKELKNERKSRVASVYSISTRL